MHHHSRQNVCYFKVAVVEDHGSLPSETSMFLVNSLPFRLTMNLKRCILESNMFAIRLCSYIVSF